MTFLTVNIYDLCVETAAEASNQKLQLESL